MNEEQRNKCDDYYNHEPISMSGRDYDIYRRAWQSCLGANGIEDDEKLKRFLNADLGVPYEQSVAPAWVLEMMRTGKPVMCWVSNPQEKGIPRKGLVSGYRTEGMFYVQGEWWTKAEPIPAWQPKDGEAVFVNQGPGRKIIVGVYSGGTVYSGSDTWVNFPMKPFDPAKIGLPWDQI